MVTNFPKARAISITVEPQRAAERSTRRHSQFGKFRPPDITNFHD
jgi:hypothetical protein